VLRSHRPQGESRRDATYQKRTEQQMNGDNGVPPRDGPPYASIRRQSAQRTKVGRLAMFELGRKRRLDVGQPLPVYPNKQTVAERHGTSHWGQQGLVSICISDPEAHARPDEEAQFHIAER
jgi:hypothetical protein